MERVKAIVDYASALQPEERENFLHQLCKEDPNLLVEVRLGLDQAHADTVELPAPANPATTEAVHFIFAEGDLIASRYVVIRAIAKGGMGEVYEVDDLELHIRVALKTISLKSATRPNALEMFRREILLARQVTHPNVCRIYDLGHHSHPTHGDLLFLTMELLHGETLAHRVRSQGPLTKAEALPLLQQMIQALSAAHRLNIAHRDFKSANVILCDTVGPSGSGPVAGAVATTVADSKSTTHPGSPSDSAPRSASAAGPISGGTPETAKPSSSDRVPSSSSQKGQIVKVTDFGLARSVDGLETTVHGEVWGTPDYMAPEQFHGQSSISSDIYSLGVVIYEMFTGKLPHRSSTGAKQSDGKPSSAMEKIPTEWRAVVKKCMAFEPVDRYATVDDVWSALNGEKIAETGRKRFFGLSSSAVAAIAAVLVAVLGLTTWVERDAIRRYFHPPVEPKHIAVLPFENIGGDSENVAFAEGMGETLTSKLSQLERFQNAFWVVPYSDARKHFDVEDAHRNLNVTLVVTGTMKRTKDSVKVTANLIDAKNHQQLGSRILTASVGDIDVLQDRVWQSVAEMVDLQVDDKAKDQLKRGDTKDPGAYDFYVQGQGYLQHYTLQSMDKAIDMFSKSLVRDESFPLAHAGLADAYSNKFRLTKNADFLQRATASAQRAAQLNDDLPYVQVTLGKIYKQSGRLDDALAAYRRAFASDPNQVIVVYRMAELYEAQGKLQAAEEAYTFLIEHHSGYWIGYSGLGSFYYRHGQFEKAAHQFQNVVDLSPDDPLGYQNLGAAYLSLGRWPEAVEQFKTGLKKDDSPAVWSNLASAYIYLGWYTEAVEAAQHATDAQPHNDNYWRNLGDAYQEIPGKAAQTKSAYERALQAAFARIQVNPKDSEALGGAALYQAHLAHAKEAEEYLRKALQVAPDDSDLLFTSALVYEIIGQREKAFSALEKAYKAGYSMKYIERDPGLKALRSDARYREWVRLSSGRAS